MNKITAVVWASVMTATCYLSTANATPEPQECKTVRLADIGWADVQATNALLGEVLNALGYQPKSEFLSINIALIGLKTGKVDAYLDYWTPTQTPLLEPFIKAGDIKVMEKPNLEAAKFTLVVPNYVSDGGLNSFEDIAKYKDKLDGKIFALEPGNDGNKLIQSMIDKNMFGLGDFKIIESSEAGMLSQVDRAARRNKWIVFLGWEPHPMNVKHKLTYLSGGDEVFGANFGAAKVYSTVAPDYFKRCPNAAKLVQNLRFTTDMESKVMASLLDKTPASKAAHDYLLKNPAAYESWLEGVTTIDGKDGLEAVKNYFKH